MSDNSKGSVEIIIPTQDAETKKESEGTSAGIKAKDGFEEMPSVTKLLNRKKLAVGKAAAENAAPAAQPAAATPVAVVAVEAAPAISLDAPAEAAAPTLEAVSIEPAAAEAAISIAPQTAAETAAASQDLPQVVAPSRRRGARTLEAVPDAPSEQAVSVTGATGVPPIFSRELILEKLDLKAFQKSLGRHKKSSNMKKLDFLGYFASRFGEMMYFEVNESGQLAGQLGFGNPQLVVHTRSKCVTPELLPGLFEALAQGEIFIGPIESLRPEDQTGVMELGFTQHVYVGAFPVMYKKSVTGVWICGGAAAQEIPQKELVALKKLLSNFVI